MRKESGLSTTDCYVRHWKVMLFGLLGQSQVQLNLVIRKWQAIKAPIIRDTYFTLRLTLPHTLLT